MGHQVGFILFPQHTVQHVGRAVEQGDHQHYAAESMADISADAAMEWGASIRSESASRIGLHFYQSMTQARENWPISLQLLLGPSWSFNLPICLLNRLTQDKAKLFLASPQHAPRLRVWSDVFN